MFALELFMGPSQKISIFHIFLLIFLFIIPAIDTLYVIHSRIKRRIHIFTAGRDHIMHQIIDKGISINKVLLLVNILNFLILVGLINSNVIKIN
jgi:UDP-GlcNAc:undecaprenyl-phosphate GlcNAc-1-phosphate transferase